MIRILVVDDSETIRQLLVFEFDRQEDMQVVGVASSGPEAVRQNEKLSPDVITMDFQMPLMDGLETTRKIMESKACPIVMISQFMDQNDKQKIFEALDAGAIAVVNKPAGMGHPDYQESIDHLLKTVRIMSEVKVITRRPNRAAAKKAKTCTYSGKPKICKETCRPDCPAQTKKCERVLIGASTGGPLALRDLFTELKAPYPLPILVVQHISKGFLPGLMDWLAKASGHTIKVAEDGIRPKAGHVYFAPDDFQMGLDATGKIILSHEAKEHSVRPSVSHLFRSAVQHGGQKNIGILLTGMGTDGSAELKQLRDAGAVTVVQSKETCVVFGMPGEAFSLGAARHVMTPEEIGRFLNQSFPAHKAEVS